MKNKSIAITYNARNKKHQNIIKNSVLDSARKYKRYDGKRPKGKISKGKMSKIEAAQNKWVLQ